MASSSQIASWKYDVFLSFRGTETRKGITVDIHDRLNSIGIKTFMDDKDIEVGDPISPTLHKAIEESRFAIIVLSPQNASSPWCLEELTWICDCMQETNRILPLFYQVIPSDVRYQNNSFKEAFDKLEKSMRHGSKLKQWRDALTKVANFSGWNTIDHKTHKELVDHIVKFLCDKVAVGVRDIVAFNKIAVGVSLSATADNSSSWLSPSCDFAFGFRQLENNEDLFLLSVWFAKIPDRTVVWYANGDRPAPKGSLMKLSASSGLELTSPQGELLWKSDLPFHGSVTVAHGVMNDQGNFVLENEKSEKLWETFKNPTDTLLPGQIIERGGRLTSRQSETDYARGRFHIDFQRDGNLVFSTTSKPYYSTATTTGTVLGSEGKRLVFSDSGKLFYILRVNGGKFKFTEEERLARDYYLRSTLNSDGVLAQYFLPKSLVGTVTWKTLWSRPDNVHLPNQKMKTSLVRRWCLWVQQLIYAFNLRGIIKQSLIKDI